MQIARPHPTTRRQVSWLLLTGLLTFALIVSGCDSSGSNEQEEEEEQQQMEETTFTVTTAQKTSAHPYSGQGFDVGYVVDGEQGKTLTLERGKTYEFQMDGVPSVHPRDKENTRTVLKTTAPAGMRPSRLRPQLTHRMCCTTTASTTRSWAGRSTLSTQGATALIPIPDTEALVTEATASGRCGRSLGR